MLQLACCTVHFYNVRFSENISVHAFRLMETAIELSCRGSIHKVRYIRAIQLVWDGHPGKLTRFGEPIPQLVN